MPRPKNHRQYPPVFHDILEALRKDKPRELQYPTIAEAKSFRLDFYAFIGAAMRDPDMVDRVNGYPFLDSLTLQVRDNPPRVILMRRSMTPMALQAEAAVEQWKKEDEKEEGRDEAE